MSGVEVISEPYSIGWTHKSLSIIHVTTLSLGDFFPLLLGIPKHPFDEDVLLMKLFLKSRCLGKPGLCIYDSLHNTLVFSIYSFGFFLLDDKVE